MPFSIAGTNWRGIEPPKMSFDELEVAAARQRLELHLAVAELAVAARLLLVAAVRLDRRVDRLAVRDPRQLQRHLDAEAALQLRDRDLDVRLPLAGEQQLLGLRVAGVADGRVFFLQPVQRRADLLLVAAALRLDRVRDDRLGERDRRHLIVDALSASTSLVCVSFSLATAPRSPALISGTFVCVLPCSSEQMAEPLGRVPASALCTVESALSVPESTRNIVMRPANGSATVFQTNAATGPASAGRRSSTSSPCAVARLERPLEPATGT